MTASKLKVYTISTEIASGSISLKKLDKEISESQYITGFSLQKSGDTLEVWGQEILNESGLDSLVANHIPYAEGEDESKLTRKQLRDKMISQDLANWGSLSNERKTEMINCFVWPDSETEENLNDLVPKLEREIIISSVVREVVTDTGYAKSSSGDLQYWKLSTDEQGLPSYIELKSNEVF